MKEKIVKSCDLELKALDESQGIVEFYFAAWNVDLTGEMILRSAYTKTLLESKERVYHNRDHHDAVGKPFDFNTDEKGAFAKSQLAMKTVAGRDVFEQYKAGLVKGHSQEFQTLQEENKMIDGNMVRVIKELRLWGLTSVTKIPANLDTPMISLKSAEDIADQLGKINKLLTTGNISDKLGERLVTEYKSLSVMMDDRIKKEAESEKPKGIDYRYLVDNID